MEKERIEETVEAVKRLADGYSAGGSREGLARTALRAVRKIAETALSEPDEE